MWDELYAWAKKKYEVLRMRFTRSKNIHPLIQQRHRAEQFKGLQYLLDEYFLDLKNIGIVIKM
ncbi:MAG: hypothetical protein F6K34_25475 [Okeania sp. SIO4D6]|uniref:hypothetical protein n=1 Tax=unclassified Okeania TaxID=2634635 RepID=UPI0013B65506|nr:MULTISPECIES: hypothetical protein [unclassified Okeania]NEP07844.1 hypothetical protein [Okeania sp. SIO4D6]NEP43955.1 hypothetical protein [Okeania sp. SIO2H7]NEP73443.1 hypothetical protein [Okeania sp. SIO2G5]NEP93154.1 hypothetical protein [Okeania sp. SIO2F5]